MYMYMLVAHASKKDFESFGKKGLELQERVVSGVLRIMWGLGWKFPSYSDIYTCLHITCTSKSGSALRAENSVIVFPDPGGPQSTMGLCSASQV